MTHILTFPVDEIGTLIEGRPVSSRITPPAPLAAEFYCAAAEGLWWQPPPERIADALDVVGELVDERGGRVGLLLQWRDHRDGSFVYWAVSGTTLTDDWRLSLLMRDFGFRVPLHPSAFVNLLNCVVCDQQFRIPPEAKPRRGRVLVADANAREIM